jgi:hypothetical protein
MEYELTFLGGPASGSIVQMVVEPTWLRWYCERAGRSWWSNVPPPLDPAPDFKVTLYKRGGYREKKDGVIKVMYMDTEEWICKCGERAEKKARGWDTVDEQPRCKVCRHRETGIIEW